jgi:hypothetical protein
MEGQIGQGRAVQSKAGRTDVTINNIARNRAFLYRTWMSRPQNSCKGEIVRMLLDERK